MATSETSLVLIVGSGLIGRSWAMLFASGGFRVKLFDVEQQQITNALENIRKDMKLLEQSNSLKGSMNAEQQLSLITGCSNIQEAVEGAMHIQRFQNQWNAVNENQVSFRKQRSLLLKMKPG